MTRFAALPLLLLITLVGGVSSFQLPPSATTRLSQVISRKAGESFSILHPAPTWSSSMTLRRSSNDNDDISGTKRGIPIFVLALLGCLWCFTIPPEFRRSHICPTPTCVESRASCYDCKTLGELKAGIQEYYRNGGGIVWDFSIDPESKLDIFK